MEPEIHLGRDEQAHLAAIRPMPGFGILLKIAKAEVDKFLLRLVNTPTTDRDAVITHHMTAQVAAQLLTGCVNKVNEELELYANAPRTTDIPVDVTEGILDIGEYSRGDDIYYSEQEEIL